MCGAGNRKGARAGGRSVGNHVETATKENVYMCVLLMFAFVEIQFVTA